MDPNRLHSGVGDGESCALGAESGRIQACNSKSVEMEAGIVRRGLGVGFRTLGGGGAGAFLGGGAQMCS